MNEFLAELYGTRETIGAEDNSDVEKLAEAQILDDVLQSEGINVDDLDDGTILKLAYEIFGDDSQLVKSAAEGDSEESDEEDETSEEKKEDESSEEKTAEADMLGRIMAHSMVQELGNIEKQAGVINPDKVRGALSHLGSMAGKGFSKGRKMGKVEGKLRELAFKSKPTAGKVKSHLAKHKGKYLAGAAAGGAAGAAGAGYAAGKKKAASALDKLAEQRALEILAENGIEINDEQSKLASAVEQRAWEMLAENGFIQE